MQDNNSLSSPSTSEEDNLSSNSALTLTLSESDFPIFSSRSSNAANVSIDWFEFAVQPKRLDQHLEELQNNSDLMPSSIDLARIFIEQCTSLPTNNKNQQIDDRTKRYLSIVSKIAYKSKFTLETIETIFPIPFQKHIFIGMLLRKRKTSGVVGLFKEEEGKIVSVSYFEIIYNQWILRAISKRIEVWFIKNPSLEGTETFDIKQLGEESLNNLIKLNDILDSLEHVSDLPNQITKSQLSNSILFDIANYYFFKEDFEKSFHYLKILYEKCQKEEFELPILRSCKTLIIACQSVFKECKLFKEHPKTYFFRQVDEVVKQLSNENVNDNDLSDKLVKLFILDNIKNNLSREYRSNLCHKFMSKDIMVFKKVLACNIIQDMLNIINSHYLKQQNNLSQLLFKEDNDDNNSLRRDSMVSNQSSTTGVASSSTLTDISLLNLESTNNTEDNSIQTHLDRFILKNKFVSSQPLVSVYIILFLKKQQIQVKEKENEEENKEKKLNIMGDDDSENEEDEEMDEEEDLFYQYDTKYKPIISEFVCRLAKYLNHPVVYSTLLSEGIDFINEYKKKVKNNLIDEYTSLLLNSIEKSYSIPNIMTSKEQSLEDQEPIFKKVPLTVQNTLLQAFEKRIELFEQFNQKLLLESNNENKLKRRYENIVELNHKLLSDTFSYQKEDLKKLKVNADNYLLLKSRHVLYRSNYGNPLILDKAISTLNEEKKKLDLKEEKKITFELILHELSQKDNNIYSIEEYVVPRVESKAVERPSPTIIYQDEFNKLCELCKIPPTTISISAMAVNDDNLSGNQSGASSPLSNVTSNTSVSSSNQPLPSIKDLPELNLVFLGELFKQLVNLQDWAFARDFYKQLLAIYEQQNSESIHTIFCRFALLVESLAYHLRMPRNGAPKKVFKDLKDDALRFVHNLIYLPSDYDHRDTYEDENRLRWDDFHLLISTSNLKFLMDLAVILSFVLVSMRMTVGNNRSQSPILSSSISPPRQQQLSGFLGHYKNLAKLIVPEYFFATSKKHWINGNEKYIEDTIIVMLQHLLERVISLQEESQQKPISSFYLFKCCLADIFYEKGKYKKALQLYLECGETNFPLFYKPSNDEVVERMIRCLTELGEFTAATVLHQFVHSAYDHDLENQSKMGSLLQDGMSYGSSNKVGYTKEVIDNLYETNGLSERWLLFFYDLSYLELLVHIAHKKREYMKEELILQHIQRSEINSNNRTEHRKEYILQMKESFVRKLYLHITTCSFN
ncbi:hypothetical protein ABK040_008165 [Willaertia magna]